MTVDTKTSLCPLCKETVAVGASRCKHCHAEISPPKKKSIFGKLDNFKSGFYAGVLLTLFVVLYFYYTFIV